VVQLQTGPPGVFLGYPNDVNAIKLWDPFDGCYKYFNPHSIQSTDVIARCESEQTWMSKNNDGPYFTDHGAGREHEDPLYRDLRPAGAEDDDDLAAAATAPPEADHHDDELAKRWQQEDVAMYLALCGMRRLPCGDHGVVADGVGGRGAGRSSPYLLPLTEGEAAEEADAESSESPPLLLREQHTTALVEQTDHAKESISRESEMTAVVAAVGDSRIGSSRGGSAPRPDVDVGQRVKLRKLNHAGGLDAAKNEVCPYLLLEHHGIVISKKGRIGFEVKWFNETSSDCIYNINSLYALHPWEYEVKDEEE
jgi:hypothetical protein